MATQHDYPAIDAAATAPGAPASVTVAISEVIADVREGLLAMAVGAGLQVMAAMMSEDVTVACGLKGKHDAKPGCDRSWRRGRQRHPRRPAGADGPPRMRATDGSGELPIPSYEVFSGTEVLGRLSMEKMLAGIRTGGGAAPSSAGTGPGRSAMIRRRSPKVLAFNAADSRSSTSPGVIRRRSGRATGRVTRSRSASETRMLSSVSCPRFLG